MSCKIFRKKILPIVIFTFFLSLLFPHVSFAKKASNKYEINAFYEEKPIMPGAARYFIRTEKIEKKTKTLNNHPINIPGNVLRKMLKQLSYKYDKDQPEIPLFSAKELTLLSEYVPQALMNSKPDEDVTFVIKGPHSSARWTLVEERLTAGRIFVANNRLNLIVGAVQINLQPSLDERYMGNVWETTKLNYDVGYRKKKTKYDGLIVVFNKESKGIYKKSNDRKDWFIFTNTAYKAAKENIKTKEMSKEQYKTLQQQIDTLQRQLNKPNLKKQQQKRNSPPPPKRQPAKRSNQSPVPSKEQVNKDNSHVLEQRLKTIDNLYKKGILSEEEYKKKRNEILKGI